MTDHRGLVMPGLEDVVGGGGISSVFQPIVDVATGAVVAYEALARGPRGPSEAPGDLFPAARRAGLLAELDAACRAAAFRGAVDAGLFDPMALFVNVEPEVLDRAPLDDLLAIAQDAPGNVRVILEITERAIAERPAELLQTVARVRALGWGIALDDVGADSMSLAFMPLLRPDVVKLDLRLVQEQPGPAFAQIMNAVNAYAERSGAVVLAEGIETVEHLATARALGATLGQGWLFGRPTRFPRTAGPVAQLAPGLVLPAHDPAPLLPELASPFDLLPPHVALRRGPKSLLIEVSKQIAREAARLGDTCVVAAAFQHARHFTVPTAQRYRDLVDRVGFVCALGDGLPSQPLPGLRGATLTAEDPVRGEWDIVVISPHFAVALLARDLGDGGPDLARSFEFSLTYDRDTVVAAAQALLSRVAPRIPPVEQAPGDRPTGVQDATVHPPCAVSGDPGRERGEVTAALLLERALAVTASGVSIVDMTAPDEPLVFVNRAFEQLSGRRSGDLLGRNCRFLQGPDTDPGAVDRIRAAIAAGQEIRETLLNYRGPERTPWWNEIHLAPVTDPGGVLQQYIGVQNDVSAQVEARRALQRERNRSRSYLSRIEELAWTDPLTGLRNRRRLQDDLDPLLWNARMSGTAVALVFLDLDGFKAVNDTLGHAAGDELLVQVAGRIRSRLRHGDLSARLGGDEFVVALPGLQTGTAVREANEIARELRRAVGEPAVVDGRPIKVTAAAGISIHPTDGGDFRSLLQAADHRMYAAKRLTTP